MDNTETFSISDHDDMSYGSVQSGKRFPGSSHNSVIEYTETNNPSDLANGHPEGKEENMYTMQEAIDHMGFKWFQIKLSLITGFTWMTEALEMMLLSIIGPVLHCEWNISAWEQAILSTLVMTGMMIGSFVWGMLGDLYGRKPALILSCVLCGYFGILTAFSPNYAWVALNRFFVGLTLGCVPQCLTLYSEYLPIKSRANAIILIEIFFSLGAAVEILMAKLLVPTLGWRYLLLFSAIPSFAMPLMAFWLPESARYLLTSGRYNEAVSVLERVARENGRQLPPGKLKPLDIQNQRPGRIQDLFTKSRRVTFVFLNLTWFLLGFAYFGIALLAPTLLANPDGCHGYDVDISKKDECGIDCVAFSDSDYDALIATSFADTPGVIFSTVLMLVMGRKACITVCLIIYALFLWLANICLSRLWLTAVLFIPRAVISGAFQTAYVYTSEIYPTNVRALGMGIGSAHARIGSIVTPYLAQVVTNLNAFISIIMYAVMGMVAIVTTLLVPTETKGKPMTESDDVVECPPVLVHESKRQ